MLNPAHINGLRALIERSLKAGLVQVTEVAALGQILLALEVEEKMYNDRKKTSEEEAARRKANQPDEQILSPE